MLQQSLKSAISNLEYLITLTNRDFESLQTANNEEVFSRIQEKYDTMSKFEIDKKNIDIEITRLLSISPTKNMGEILSPDDRALLDDLRSTLENLKKENKKFAKASLAISEFYSSLLKRLIPQESTGYGPRGKTQSSILTLEG